MKNICKYFVILILLLYSSIQVKANENIKTYQILILNTDGENYPATNALIEAYKTQIQSENLHIEYIYENLNLYLYLEEKEDYYQIVAESFKIKYKQRTPSLIFAIEFGAVEFLKQFGNSIFGDTPILTAGTAEINEIITQKNWFQVLDTMDVNQMFYTIEKVQPKVRKIHAIIGDSPFENKIRDWYIDKLKNYNGKAEIIFTKNSSHNEILNLAKEADINSVLYYIYFFQSNLGDKYIPKNILDELNQVSVVPVYSYMEHYITDHILGGYVISFETLGTKAAEKSISILKNPDKLINKVTEISTCRYVFNWKALQRFQIDSDKIPAESIIILKKYNVWQLYWPYIIGSLALILLQTNFIVNLLRNKKKRRQAELQLEKLNKNLEHTIEQQVAAIKTKNLKLLETNKQIVSLQHFKEEMTRTIVHDLKSPLDSILNSSQFPTSEIKLKQIKHSAQRMLNMVLNILDIHKYESTKMVLNKESCYLGDITNNAINDVIYFADNKSISIENMIHTGIEIDADREILLRVITNLLINAIKYTPNNGHIKIKTYDEVTPLFVKVEISDNGIGIPQDRQEIVFEKFHQLRQNQTDSIHSSGLGLTFCKMAVEAHGGSIGVKTTKEIGTTIWFNLPCTSIKKHIESNILQDQEEKIILSSAEKKSLQVIIPFLEKHDVYEITSLRKILKRIEAEELGNEIWKNEFKRAINHCNKELYHKLIEILK